jgi:hypothetical protein
VIVFRHADPSLPFLWEDAAQPAGRWHAEGEGPAHCFADTPDGAWAEFLRHEEITDPDDLAHVRRAIWAVEIPDDEPAAQPELDAAILTGGLRSYEPCQAEARRLRAAGASRLEAPSAALAPGSAHGHRVDNGLQPGPPRDPHTIVLFGPRPAIVGWQAVYEGRPAAELLARVRKL